MPNTLISSKRLLKEMQKNISEDDAILVSKAYAFSKNAHGNQKRLSGHSYFSHPVNVAFELAQQGFGAEIISAALLHDTLEDTTVHVKLLKKEFGENVAYLVEGVTKIDALTHGSKKTAANQSIHKMFSASAKDINVLIVKLADNLHNMRTIKFLPEARRKKYAKLSLDIFVPLSKRLGLNEWADELGDLAFEVLEPAHFANLFREMRKKRKEARKEISTVIRVLRNAYKKAQVIPEFRVYEKTLYATHFKMVHANKDIDEITDSVILLILVDSVINCYNGLGVVHQNFLPKPGKMKDYIAIPKDEFYQSLHTTIIGPSGKSIKIYIRTPEMDALHRNGIAELLLNESKFDELNEKIEWLDDLSKLSQVAENESYLALLKSDYLDDSIMVFDAKGTNYELSYGSTPLDLAFNEDKKRAAYLLNAKVNGRTVPIWQELHNGDKVILLYDSKVQFKPDWVYFVRSQTTKDFLLKLLGTQKVKGPEKVFDINLRAKILNTSGTLHKLTALIAKYGINIISVRTMHGKSHPSVYFTLRFRDQKALSVLLKNFNAMQEIVELKYHLL
jgi:GTP diphosphokinase / guanosine-3',5'-bis(diphosphate) 3'-diphosphatase